MRSSDWSSDVCSSDLASVTVAKGGVVGSSADNPFGGVYANADGTDYTTKQERSFTRVPAEGTATASDKYTSSYATSADVGDATVAVAGTVAGNAESSTTRGNATTTVTGTIGGDAVATAAYGNDYQSSSTTDYAGKVARSAEQTSELQSLMRNS